LTKKQTDRQIDIQTNNETDEETGVFREQER